MRAPRHDRVAVLLGQDGELPRKGHEVAPEDRVGRFQLQHHPRVDHVLGRGAPVHPAPGGAGDPRELAHDGHERVRRHDEVALDRRKVEVLDARGARDRLGVLPRDEVQVRLGARERGLDVEPELQHAALVEHGADLRRRELVAEELIVDEVARHR